MISCPWLGARRLCRRGPDGNPSTNEIKLSALKRSGSLDLYLPEKMDNAAAAQLS